MKLITTKKVMENCGIRENDKIDYYEIKNGILLKGKIRCCPELEKVRVINWH